MAKSATFINGDRTDGSDAALRIDGLTALGSYFGISVLLFGLPVIRDLSAAHIGYMNDPAMMMWCMTWWPYALIHGINPFFTHIAWASSGYNLTWSASIPALAAAFAPLTLVWGAVVSYNLAALAGPALSGWAAFLLCRHVTRRFAGGFAGGLLYGFSPYQVGHVLAGHLNLTFVFIPPLCVLLVLLLLGEAIGSRVFVTVLAFLLVIQCLISTEILATMTMFGALALLVAIMLMPPQRYRLLAAILPIGCAYVAAVIMLTPFVYYAFAAGAVPRDAIFPSALFSADLLSFIVPTQLMLVCPDAELASRLCADINLLEKGAYLGVPLLVLASLYFVPRRREAVAQLLMLLLLVVAIAALGPVLHVDGRSLFALPGALVDALPLIGNALPIRFVNYGFLISAIIVSLWLSAPGPWARLLLPAAVLVALFPNPILMLRQTTYDTPAFFSQGLYRDHLHRGENVLVIPYGMNGHSMAWQAESWMYFRMAGGYLGRTPEAFRRWPIVNTLLTSMPVPMPAAQLGAFAAAEKIDAIVVADGVTGAASELPATLGLRPVKVGGVSLYRLPHGVDADPPVKSLPALQRAAAEAWFAQLLCAAHRFVAGRHNLADLNPVRVRELGLLPDSKWGQRLDLVLAGAPHGVFNGLWIGPGRNGAIEVGMFASRAVIEPLASRYGPDVTSIVYPYPYRFAGRPPSDDSVHFLLITLRLDSARHSCPGTANGVADRSRLSTSATTGPSGGSQES